MPTERRETSFMVALTRTGWLILVLALLGEAIAQNNKDADNKLIVAALGDNAGKANERAGNLETEAARLQSGNLTLQKEVAKAQTAMEEEHKERLALENRVAWRLLSDQQYVSMTNTLSTQPATVLIQYPVNDTEALFFSFEIGKVFEAAHWNVIPDGEMWNAIFSNVRILGDSPNSVALVRSSFATAKVDFSAAPPPSDATVIFSIKPPNGPKPDVVVVVGISSSPFASSGFMLRPGAGVAVRTERP